jgi:hypothetical protein
MRKEVGERRGGTGEWLSVPPVHPLCYGTAFLRLTPSFQHRSSKPCILSLGNSRHFWHRDKLAAVRDISVPRQIGTRTIRHLKKTNQHFFNLVCSRKRSRSCGQYCYAVYNCHLTLWNWKKFFCPIHFIRFLGFYSKFSQYGLHMLQEVINGF